jgi:hypothetical protein
VPLNKLRKLDGAMEVRDRTGIYTWFDLQLYTSLRTLLRALNSRLDIESRQGAGVCPGL